MIVRRLEPYPTWPSAKPLAHPQGDWYYHFTQVAKPAKQPAPQARRAVESAADRVRKSILRGDVAPGSSLPGERDLAETLGVSRLTLRSAISRLEAEGLVQPVHGSGTRVLDYRERGGVDLIGYLAAQAMEGGVVPFALLRDLLELRRMIAVELLPLIVERASDDDLATLRAHLAHQRTLLGDRDAWKRADLAFARLLVRAGKNLALELLFNTVIRVIDAHPGLDIAFQANADQTIGVYERLLLLLEARDRDRLVRIADRLLRHLDHRTLTRVSELTGQTLDFERTER